MIISKNSNVVTERRDHKHIRMISVYSESPVSYNFRYDKHLQGTPSYHYETSFLLMASE